MSLVVYIVDFMMDLSLSVLLGWDGWWGLERTRGADGKEEQNRQKAGGTKVQALPFAPPCCSVPQPPPPLPPPPPPPPPSPQPSIPPPYTIWLMENDVHTVAWDRQKDSVC